MTAKTIAAAGAALALALCAGCVRQDFSGCLYPLRLKLQYTYNREGRCLLREEIGCFSLGLFDAETGKEVRRASLTQADLDADNAYTWEVPPGHYNVVAWGGADRRHTIAAGVDLASHGAAIEAEGDGTVAHRREHLWNAVAPDVRVSGNISSPRVLELHKLTNDLTVTVASSDGSPLPAQTQQWVSASNGLYTFSGALHPDAPLLTYLPGRTASRTASRSGNPGAASDSGTDTAYYTLGTLERDDDSRLSLALGDATLYDGSLSDLIARQPDIIFDLDDDFKVDFLVDPSPSGEAAVKVIVNGWNVIEYNATLK